MTKEEAIISRQDVLDLIEHYNSDALGTVFIDWEHGKKFEEEIKSLPSAQKTGKWIPVSERLPDKNGEYLVTVRKGSRSAFNGEATVYQDTFQFLCQWDDCGEDVVAWMPLPEPYTEEEQ